MTTQWYWHEGRIQGQALKLNVGAGCALEEGYINCDWVAAPGIDAVFDLMQHWPFDDNSVDEVKAFEVVEHLPNLIHFMDEAWRVLKPDGTLIVRTCPPFVNNAWRDPTHVRPYLPESFQYFDSDSPYHRWGRLYTDKAWRFLGWEHIGRDAFLVRLMPRREAASKPQMVSGGLSGECKDNTRNGKLSAGKQEDANVLEDKLPFAEPLR